MNSWVYIFSRFTPEALLFEALAIFVLSGAYAAYWVLKKRKLGAIQIEVPATVIKGYLNELIVDAEQLRAQLFGLLSAAGMSPHEATRAMTSGAPLAAATAAMPAGVSMDPELLKKLAALEFQMSEQAKAMAALTGEKTQLEKELADARAGAGAAPGQGGGDPAAVAKLEEKIKQLEGKLAEYSVIEDDLANLKRLQQENAQLKAALGGKAAAPAAPAPQAGAAPEAAFEGLVDQVEQSLQPTAQPQAVEAPPAAAPAAAPAAGAVETKSDADLVAEFEKMLNG